jgi:hypothetical protein
MNEKVTEYKIAMDYDRNYPYTFRKTAYFALVGFFDQNNLPKVDEDVPILDRVPLTGLQKTRLEALVDKFPALTLHFEKLS